MGYAREAESVKSYQKLTGSYNAQERSVLSGDVKSYQKLTGSYNEVR